LTVPEPAEGCGILFQAAFDNKKGTRSSNKQIIKSTNQLNKL
jgi:hypothetical protein